MKASEVKRLLPDQKIENHGGEYMEGIAVGHNELIDEISSKEIVVDVKAIANIIYQRNVPQQGTPFNMEAYADRIATALSNSMGEWLKCKDKQ